MPKIFEKEFQKISKKNFFQKFFKFWGAHIFKKKNFKKNLFSKERIFFFQKSREEFLWQIPKKFWKCQKSLNNWPTYLKKKFQRISKKFFFRRFFQFWGGKIQYPRFNISPKGDIRSNQQHKALYHRINRSPKGDICSSQNTGLDIAALEDPLKGIYRKERCGVLKNNNQDRR